ncbi:uncharacterized mitochondrial protein-like protein [Tanacetum coccineum]
MDSIISLVQKNTLAEYMILSGADNRPPMLDKDLYDSWKRQMELYMQNREHGRMILESVEHGPLIWPTVEENGVIRTKKYTELSAVEKIQADCDMKTTNIILQGLPVNIYSLVNHHRVAKDLWERVQLLMQGTSLTKQERECKLYDAFDKFTHIKGELLHTYYLRFTQLINDMNIYKMKMEQFQVNTKFLNSLPPEWSKFVTDVKLVKDLHTSNFDQLYAYLEQHELHANEVRFAVPVFSPGDDPIACLNKAMTFLTVVASSRFPSTNNQLKTSSNLRNQATIQDGRVIVQQVQERQGQNSSRTTFLKSKDESSAAIIKCIKNIQVRLNATVQNIRTDNGTEFVNQTLREFYENVGITHQTSVARTPQWNGVVERRNQTLVEAARTMLIFSKAPLFLWAEAINLILCKM